MKNTKLAIELAKIRESHADWVEADEHRRKEFAKAFRWHKQPKPYSGVYDEPPEPILPSWEQIWVNLGTLLAARNFIDFEDNVSELEAMSAARSMKLQQIKELLEKRIKHFRKKN